MQINYEEIPTCPFDGEPIMSLSKAFVDPFSDRYFHNREEAEQHAEGAAYYNQPLLVNDQTDEFGSGYKTWIR